MVVRVSCWRDTIFASIAASVGRMSVVGAGGDGVGIVFLFARLSTPVQMNCSCLIRLSSNLEEGYRMFHRG